MSEKCELPIGHVTTDEFGLVRKMLWVIFPKVVDGKQWTDPYAFVEAGVKVWMDGRPTAGRAPEERGGVFAPDPQDAAITAAERDFLRALAQCQVTCDGSQLHPGRYKEMLAAARRVVEER